MTRYQTTVESGAGWDVAEWRCPTCKAGGLRLLKRSLRTRPSAYTARYSNDEDWDLRNDVGVFSGILRCERAACREMVAIVGETYTDAVYDRHPLRDETVELLTTIFRPMYFVPPLEFISLPVGCPHEVSKHLRESFAQYPSNLSGAANAVRTAIEALLTKLQVPRFERKNGRQSRIMLGARLGRLKDDLAKAKKKHKLGEKSLVKLQAIKWIGNSGSHADESVPREEVDLSYDLMGSVLRDLYDGSEGELIRKAGKVIRENAPKRKKK